MKEPEDPRFVIARFRYGVIAPLVVRSLGPGELSHLLTDLSSRLWDTPNGQTTRIHRRTLTRWLARYRQDGFEGLLPEPRKDRGVSTRLSDTILERAMELRREDPQRSVYTIIRILEVQGLAEPGAIKRSTLSHAFCRKGLSRAQLLRERALSDSQTYRRRESPYPGALWQADTQLALYLPDSSGRKRTLYLVACIDDFSRHVIARFYLADNRPSLADLLKRAVLQRGKPEVLYVDNGANYRSHMLEDACAYLGIELRHARPYRPQGKGKVERFFQNCDRFNREAQALIDHGQITTLDQVRTLFASWLQSEYNLRVHSATHERPEDRLRHVDPAHPVEMLDPDQVHHAFLWRESRKVSRAGTISVEGNEYEVDVALARRTVDVRYDPYDLTTIYVEFQGQAYGTAVPINVHRRRSSELPQRDREEGKEQGEGTARTPTPFLDLLHSEAEEARRKALGSMRFHQGPDDESQKAGDEA